MITGEHLQISGEAPAADGQSKFEPPVLIGSTPVGPAIALCCLQLFCLGCLAGTSMFFAFVSPENNGSTTQDISPTMVVLGILSFLIGFAGFHDLYRTCGLLHIGPQGVTWEFQHKLFKRAVFPFIANSLLLFPLIFTFVLHSRGVEFNDLLGVLNQDYDELLVYHIVLTIINLVSGAFLVPYVHFSLKLGLFGKEDRTVGYMFTKFCAIPFALTTLIMDIVLVYLVAYLRSNSGAITFTALYIVTSIPVLRFMFMFIFRGSQLYSQRWLIALRASVVLHLGICYMAGWVVLMMMVLEGTGADGFWISVQNLTEKRSKAVYLHFSMYLILLATVSYRVFLAKLRRRGRAAKILVAVTGNNIPEAAIERFEKENKKNPLLKDGGKSGNSITSAFVAIDRIISGDGNPEGHRSPKSRNAATEATPAVQVE